MRSKVFSLFAATFLALATNSQATVLADGNYISDFLFNSSSVQPNFVPLRGSEENRSNFISFIVPKSGKVKITYTAECAFFSSNNTATSWVDIDIVVDNDTSKPLPPTAGSVDAFCGGAASGSVLLTRASITVVTRLSAGRHTVRVNARIASNRDPIPSTLGGLSQSTIVIEQ